MMANKRFVDLSHTIEHGMITYKGLPGPVISDYRSREDSRSYYAAGTEFQIGKIDMVANTGTYLDAPFHRFAKGKDLSELPLESLADICGVRLSAGTDRRIDADLFAGKDLAGKAVLVHTGWSKHWLTENYFLDPPFLTRAAAESLVKAGAVLVGIDSMNIDDVHDTSRPVHTLLLEANIPVVEHLTCLELLPETGFRFFALPAKIKAFGSFPVRAFAIV
ncbi:MAG TPA: cyclase family protein [Candidatus Angelobacter sp.]|nr:cyclase family protein [Candidatus Angelobacter sp.]HKT49023.1 cyclase family protein [Candidatus Angelobacter sp.]